MTGVFGLLQQTGLPVANPLAAASTALFGVATVDLWHWWGFLCVIFFAALRQVPQEQIEAARIEGATFWQMMRYVLLPGIRPTITLMMIMTVIWSFLVFDFVYILTQGGPAFSSEVLSTLAYRKAFYDLNVGQAAAAALVISLFGLVATYFYIRVQSQRGRAMRLVESRTHARPSPMSCSAIGCLHRAVPHRAPRAQLAQAGAARSSRTRWRCRRPIRWDNFTRAWADARFGQTFVNSVAADGADHRPGLHHRLAHRLCAGAQKIKSWKIVTFYLLATTTAPIQLFLFPLYFGFAKLGLINNVFAVALDLHGHLLALRDHAAADLLPRRAQGARGGGADRRRDPLAGLHPGHAADRLARHPDRGADHRALLVERVPDRHDLPADSRTSSPPWSRSSCCRGQYSSDWGEIMAAALIIVLPVVILFVLLQRRFIEGMAGGSVKG